MRRARVILVREWEQQMSGSGCCGRLEGEFLGCADGPVFRERRETMESMGPLYRGLREELGPNVDVEVVDPRNMLSLFPMLLHDFWSFRVPLREALRTLGRVGVQAVVVNGRIVARGVWPRVSDVAELVAELGRGRVVRPGAARLPS